MDKPKKPLLQPENNSTQANETPAKTEDSKKSKKPKKKKKSKAGFTGNTESQAELSAHPAQNLEYPQVTKSEERPSESKVEEQPPVILTDTSSSQKLEENPPISQEDVKVEEKPAAKKKNKKGKNKNKVAKEEPVSETKEEVHAPTEPTLVEQVNVESEDKPTEDQKNEFEDLLIPLDPIEQTSQPVELEKIQPKEFEYEKKAKKNKKKQKDEWGVDPDKTWGVKPDEN